MSGVASPLWVRTPDSREGEGLGSLLDCTGPSRAARLEPVAVAEILRPRLRAVRLPVVSDPSCCLVGCAGKDPSNPAAGMVLVCPMPGWQRVATQLQSALEMIADDQLDHVEVLVGDRGARSDRPSTDPSSFDGGASR